MNKRSTGIRIFLCFFLLALNAVAHAQIKKRSYRKITQPELLDTIFNCTVIKDQVYLDGDIYLGDTTELNRLQNLAFAIVIDDNFIFQTRWQRNIVPVEFDTDFLLAEKNVIIEALNEMMEASYLSFRMRTNENDYIYYKKVTEKALGFCGGRSPVGRKGGKQEIHISCLSPKTVRHETMHSLGFYHEQSRADRDNFVEILTANIEPDATYNFDKHVFFAKDIGSYDFASVMHYHARAFGIEADGFPKRTIVRKSNRSDTSFGSSDLSAGDIAALKTIYPLSNISREPIPIYSDLFSDNEQWTSGAFYGTKGTFIADVTGDRKADAIVVNDLGITVRRAFTTYFTANESWSTDAFFGNKGTYFADVTGDGKADAIAVSVTGTRVRKSNGITFSPPETWIAGLFEDTKGSYFADVNGDRKADYITVGLANIKVRLSNGTGFDAAQTWTTNAYYGTRGTFFADVTGDGKADAIVVNDFGVTVRYSNGNRFTDNVTWTSNPYYGTRGTYFADVTGDGKADAIVVNDFGVTVRRSSGTRFSPNETGTSNPYYADRAMIFADVTGSGKCAAIVVNNDRVYVRPAY